MSAASPIIPLLLIGYGGAVLGIALIRRKARQLATEAPRKAERLRRRGKDSLTVLAAVSSLMLDIDLLSAMNTVCSLWFLLGGIMLIWGLLREERDTKRAGIILIILALIVPYLGYSLKEEIAEHFQ